MSKQSRVRFFLPILLMDTMVLTFMQPVRFSGFIMMNAISITTLLVALRVMTVKHPL